MTATPSKTPGIVYMIGAGPGDPGLITVRAVECLARADVVLYDYLVGPAALDYAAPGAELVCLGSHAFGRKFTPDEVIQRMLAEAMKGRTVARLKGGDPSIFGRGADETVALREAGIPFEMIPGITAAVAAAAYCEIPITHHDDASAVALIAGQERHTKTESQLDYGKLAEFPGTLMLYMGVRTASRWTRALIDHGKPPDTPVAIVRRCTWPSQRMIRCTLETVVEAIERESVRPPAIFVVGKVADRAPAKSWFDSRPLFGLRVLVTGSPSSSQKLRAGLTGQGAEVLVQPAIRITDPPDWAAVDAALERLGQYDWLVFSSPNGVDHFLRRLFQTGGDARRLANVKLAVVGRGTADRLAHYHLQTDLTPERFNAESLAEALVGEATGRRFLLARASRGRELLGDELRRAGGDVDQVVVYSAVDVQQADPKTVEALASGGIDWVTVTSSATAASLSRLYGDALKKARLVSISPLTSAALRKLGHEPAAEATEHTMDGVVEALLCAHRV